MMMASLAFLHTLDIFIELTLHGLINLWWRWRFWLIFFGEVFETLLQGTAPNHTRHGGYKIIVAAVAAAGVGSVISVMSRLSDCS